MELFRKVSKYEYIKVIQQSTGQGWEDQSEYTCNSSGAMDFEQKDLLKHDVKEYRRTGYPTRVVFRRRLRKD